MTLGIRRVGVVRPLVLAALFAAPIFMTLYTAQVADLVLIYAIVAIGLAVAMGFAGQVNLAQVAFFGVSAYTSAILTVQHHWSPWAAAPVAIVAAALSGLLIGLPALRVQSHYLGIVSLGLAVAFASLLTNAGFTGGAEGLFGVPPLTLPGIDLADKYNFYYVALTALLVMGGFALLIARTTLGRRFRAMRDDTLAAAAVGVEIPQYRLMAFVLAGLFAGVAGVLYDGLVHYVSPDTFSLSVMFLILAMVIVGGQDSVWGTAFGVLLLYATRDVLSGFQRLQVMAQVLYGGLIVLTVVFAPRGLAGTATDLIARFALRLPRAPLPSVRPPAPVTPPPTPAPTTSPPTPATVTSLPTPATATASTSSPSHLAAQADLRPAGSPRFTGIGGFGGPKSPDSQESGDGPGGPEGGVGAAGGGTEGPAPSPASSPAAPMVEATTTVTTPAAASTASLPPTGPQPVGDPRFTGIGGFEGPKSSDSQESGDGPGGPGGGVRTAGDGPGGTEGGVGAAGGGVGAAGDRPRGPGGRPGGPGDGGVALEVGGIVKRFRGLSALGGVSLTVRQGEIHGIIGPNGSGKTTLFNVISGIYRPEEGRVALWGRDVTRRPAHRLSRLGLARTFQNLRLFHRLTVLDNVLVALDRDRWYAHLRYLVAPWSAWLGESRRRAIGHGLLHQAGLDGVAGEVATNLPYGRQRRLEIARALAAGPRLLLLDEPAAGLNAAEAEELKATIRRIRESGVTVVLIEHNMALVMSLCERITVLAHGRVIASGTPTEVSEEPAVIEAYLGAEFKAQAAG